MVYYIFFCTYFYLAARSYCNIINKSTPTVVLLMNRSIVGDSRRHSIGWLGIILCLPYSATNVNSPFVFFIHSPLILLCQPLFTIAMRAFVIPLILIQTTAFTLYHTTQVGNSRFGEKSSTIRYASSIHQHHHAERNIVVLSHNVSQHVLDGHYDVNYLLKGRVDVLCRCINSALWVSKGIRKDTTIYMMLFPNNSEIGTTIEVSGREVIELNPDERTIALYLQRALLAANRRVKRNTDTDNIKQQQKQIRQEEEIKHLLATDRRRPDTINPNKPGSLTKSQRRILRKDRMARQAMARRIKRSSRDSSPPQGFAIHQETLEERLEKLDGKILMLNELGKPISDVLSSTVQSNANGSDDDNTSTSIILGDQMGYASCDEEILLKNENITQVSLGPLSLLTSQCITIVHHYFDAQTTL